MIYCFIQVIECGYGIIYGSFLNVMCLVIYMVENQLVILFIDMFLKGGSYEGGDMLVSDLLWYFICLCSYLVICFGCFIVQEGF